MPRNYYRVGGQPPVVLVLAHSLSSDPSSKFRLGDQVILSARRTLYKTRAKMLLRKLASLGLASFLCQAAYGQCKLEQGEFYLLGSDPVTFYYDPELRDVAKSKAIEDIDVKTPDDSHYYFPNPTVCGE